jgi:competence protein ComEA
MRGVDRRVAGRPATLDGMSPSPADRFSALLARSGERGWTPADRADDLDTEDALPGDDDAAWENDEPRGVRPGLTRTLLLVLLGFVLTGVLVVVLAPSLLSGGEKPVAAPEGQEAPEWTEAAGATADPTPGEDSPVVVHVVGAVARPGVVELPAHARVGDALEAAGGPQSDADTDGVNLARTLVDGEQIRVPRDGEEPPAVLPDAGGTGDAGGAGHAEDAAPLLDLNTADLEQLQTLQGIGPVTAQAILDHREAVGRFGSVEELLDVTGIGDATLAAIRDAVTVG